MHSTDEYKVGLKGEEREAGFRALDWRSTRSQNNQACLPSSRSFTHNRHGKRHEGPTYARRVDTKHPPIPNNRYPDARS